MEQKLDHQSASGISSNEIRKGDANSKELSAESVSSQLTTFDSQMKERVGAAEVTKNSTSVTIFSKNDIDGSITQAPTGIVAKGTRHPSFRSAYGTAVVGDIGTVTDRDLYPVMKGLLASYNVTDAEASLLSAWNVTRHSTLMYLQRVNIYRNDISRFGAKNSGYSDQLNKNESASAIVNSETFAGIDGVLISNALSYLSGDAPEKINTVFGVVITVREVISKIVEWLRSDGSAFADSIESELSRITKDYSVRYRNIDDERADVWSGVMHLSTLLNDAMDKFISVNKLSHDELAALYQFNYICERNRRESANWEIISTGLLDDAVRKATSIVDGAEAKYREYITLLKTSALDRDFKHSEQVLSIKDRTGRLKSSGDLSLPIRSLSQIVPARIESATLYYLISLNLHQNELYANNVFNSDWSKNAIKASGISGQNQSGGSVFLQAAVLINPGITKDLFKVPGNLSAYSGVTTSHINGQIIKDNPGLIPHWTLLEGTRIVSYTSISLEGVINIDDRNPTSVNQVPKVSQGSLTSFPGYVVYEDQPDYIYFDPFITIYTSFMEMFQIYGNELSTRILKDDATRYQGGILAADPSRQLADLLQTMTGGSDKLKKIVSTINEVQPLLQAKVSGMKMSLAVSLSELELDPTSCREAFRSLLVGLEQITQVDTAVSAVNGFLSSPVFARSIAGRLYNAYRLKRLASAETEMERLRKPTDSIIVQRYNAFIAPANNTRAIADEAITTASQRLAGLSNVSIVYTGEDRSTESEDISKRILMETQSVINEIDECISEANVGYASLIDRMRDEGVFLSLVGKSIDEVDTSSLTGAAGLGMLSSYNLPVSIRDQVYGILADVDRAISTALEIVIKACRQTMSLKMADKLDTIAALIGVLRQQLIMNNDDNLSNQKLADLHRLYETHLQSILDSCAAALKNLKLDDTIISDFWKYLDITGQARTYKIGEHVYVQEVYLHGNANLRQFSRTNCSALEYNQMIKDAKRLQPVADSVYDRSVPLQDVVSTPIALQRHLGTILLNSSSITTKRNGVKIRQADVFDADRSSLKELLIDDIVGSDAQPTGKVDINRYTSVKELTFLTKTGSDRLYPSLPTGKTSFVPTGFGISIHLDKHDGGLSNRFNDAVQLSRKYQQLHAQTNVIGQFQVDVVDILRQNRFMDIIGQYKRKQVFYLDGTFSTDAVVLKGRDETRLKEKVAELFGLSCGVNYPKLTIGQIAVAICSHYDASPADAIMVPTVECRTCAGGAVADNVKVEDLFDFPTDMVQSETLFKVSVVWRHVNSKTSYTATSIIIRDITADITDCAIIPVWSLDRMSQKVGKKKSRQVSFVGRTQKEATQLEGYQMLSTAQMIAAERETIECLFDISTSVLL